MAFNDDYAIPEEEDLGTVILTMDDDSELECDIIAIFSAKMMTMSTTLQRTHSTSCSMKRNFMRKTDQEK